MTRILTIVALLFATPAWADEVFHLRCTYTDGSQLIWRLYPKSMFLELGSDKYKCKKDPDYYICASKRANIVSINRYSLFLQQTMKLSQENSEDVIELQANCIKINPEL